MAGESREIFIGQREQRFFAAIATTSATKLQKLGGRHVGDAPITMESVTAKGLLPGGRNSSWGYPRETPALLVNRALVKVVGVGWRCPPHPRRGACGAKKSTFCC